MSTDALNDLIGILLLDFHAKLERDFEALIR